MTRETINLEELSDEDDTNNHHPDDPGEVPTSFATKGIGWSGREDPEDDDPPA